MQTASYWEPVDNSRDLRAGDPDATPGAAVLAKGEAVVFHPNRSIARAADSLR